MNIGVVSRAVEQYGGAEIYLLQCLRRWQEQDEVTLYAERIDRGLLAAFGVDPDRIRCVTLPGLGERDTRRFDLFEDLVILPRIWATQIGVHDVHFLNGCPTHLVPCTPSVYLCHEPLRMLYDLRYQQERFGGDVSLHVYPEQDYRSVTHHDYEAQLPLIEAIDRRIRVTRMAANSRWMAAYAGHVYDRPADLIAHPGVDRLERPTAPAASRRAVYVGRLWAHKRIHLLIEAIALVEDGHLDLVGEGAEEPELRRLAAELEVEDRVFFHGRLSNEAVARVLEASTCGAYVPVREPFGMMPIEAAAAGRPVVVAPEGGYTEILDHRSALICEPTPPAIAQAFTRLFDDPALAARMGRAAHEAVASTTWDRTAGRLRDLMIEAVDDVRSSSTQVARPLLGAHFYPWYDARGDRRHWNENSSHSGITDEPIGGYYTSSDPGTIERQLDEVERAGIDFLVVNWEVGHKGVLERHVQATRALLDAAARRGSPITATVMLSFGTTLTGPVDQAILELERLVGHPAWAGIRGRPMQWFFFSGSFLACFFTHRDRLREAFGDRSVLAAGAITAPANLPGDVLEFIDGWSLYRPFETERVEDATVRLRDTHRRHVGVGRDPIRVVTVSPGYDDRHLTTPGRKELPVRYVPRADGDTYRGMLDAVLGMKVLPEAVVITSYNEFHENTHIESSRAHGSEFIRQTAAFAKRLDPSIRGERA